MAIQSAEAKLYQGIRCYVVDKNISAALTATFTTGHTRRNEDGDIVYDGDGVKVIDADILGFKIIRTIADLLCPRPQPLLVDERYLTYGGSNLEGVINPAQPWIETATLRCDNQVTFFRLDFATLGIPEGQDCVVMLEEGFVYETKGRKTANGQSNIYPLAVEGAPSARNDFFASFRTPKTLSLTQAQITASLYNLYGRIRPFEADLTDALGFTVIGNYSPTDRIQLIGSSFFILPSPVKTTDTEHDFNIISSINANNRRVRIADAIPLDAESTVATLGSIRYRQGLAEMPAATFLIGSGERELGVITAAITATASVEFDIGIIKVAAQTTPVTASMTIDATKTTNINETLEAQVSMTSEGSVPMIVRAITTGYASTQTVRLPIYFGNINAQIDWGDGTSETITSLQPFIDGGNANGISHTYPLEANQYTIRISGYVQAWGLMSVSQWGSNEINLNRYQNAMSYLQIDSWGYIGLEYLHATFTDLMYYGYVRQSWGWTGDDIRLNVPTRLPETTRDISYMFKHRTADDQSWVWDVSNWDTGNVVNMEQTFFRVRGGFDDNLGNWDVSKVTNFSNMFHFASNFTGQGLGNWDTGSATSMRYMFYFSGMNTSLNDWDVESVVDFRFMFAYSNYAGFETGPAGSTGTTAQLFNWAPLSVNDNTKNAAFEQFLYTGYGQDLSWWCVPNITSAPTTSPFPYQSSAPQIYPPIWGTCPGPRPVIASVVPSSTLLNEGETLTVTVTLANRLDGILYWGLNADYPNWEYPFNWNNQNSSEKVYPTLDLNPYQGTIEFINGVGTIQINILTDNQVEALSEKFRIDIFSQSGTQAWRGAYLMGQTPTITINANNT